MERLFGNAADAFVGRPLFNGVSAQLAQMASPPNFRDVQIAVAKQGWFRLDAPWQKSDGQVLWGDCVIAPVFEPDGSTSGYVAVIRDVTGEHAHIEHLLETALTDPLTGLYNRRGLEERADGLGRRASGAPLSQAWIMVDIDHFERVNDTNGHDAGDAVLKTVAAALRATARDADILARFGG